MRKSIIAAMAGFVLLAGCGPQEKPAVTPKKHGPPYQIAFGPEPAKPNPAGITIPAIKYTYTLSNTDAQERRAALVVRFDVSGGNKDAPVMNQMIMAPTDIPGSDGTLSAAYMDATNKDLAQYLASYCLKGKVKISVAIARSSLSPQASDAEIDTKRLSDWVPIELVFKNPHPRC